MNGELLRHVNIMQRCCPHFVYAEFISALSMYGSHGKYNKLIVFHAWLALYVNLFKSHCYITYVYYQL